MSNIFNIQEKYLSLLNEIEENDGLLEDGQEKELSIVEEELEDKLKSYYYIIKKLEGESKLIDDEIKRLSDAKKVKSNIIARLKTNMRDAVILFGETGKSGNKIIDYGTIKFYTRKNEVLQFSNIDNFYNVDYINYKFNENLSVEQFNTILKELNLNSNDIKFNTTIDKRKLKSDLKDKVEVDGVLLVRSDSILIK